jgi:hypothetical protein
MLKQLNIERSRPMAQAISTTDHETIRQWAEQREGYPASVAGTKGDESAGLLRIDFPGFEGEDTLETITWDEFFEKFDEENLEFLYQEDTDDGERSRFCKFVRRTPK